MQFLAAIVSKKGLFEAGIIILGIKIVSKTNKKTREAA